MKYLQEELALFARVKAEFADHYKHALRLALDRMEERGEALDTGSPIHHRMSAEGMLHEIAKKARRCQGVLEAGDWNLETDALAKLHEEAVDIVNYAAFLAALAAMLLVDATGRKE